MARSVQQAFAEFNAKITPTPIQAATMIQRRTSAEDVLRRAFAQSNMPLLRAFGIGSADRGTAIRPLDDVDLFAVFTDQQVWPQYQHDSTKLLYRVRDALNASSPVSQVGARGQAVRLTYNVKPNVEIVPAFVCETGGYLIPSGRRNGFLGLNFGWTQTAPEYHTAFINRRDQELGGQLKPLIRMLKCWSRAHGSRLSSFHLEMMAQQSFSSIGSDFPPALEMFFGNAIQHLNVDDPNGYGPVGGQIELARYFDLGMTFSSAKGQCQEAIAEAARGDHAGAIARWRRLFGDEFPVYG